MKPSDLTKNAKRFRTMARGYRSLKPTKAKVYDAAAQVLERVVASRSAGGNERQGNRSHDPS